MSEFFALKRDGEGRPVLELPTLDPPDPKGVFRRRCYANGISDPKVVAKLWDDEKQRLEALNPAPKKKRRRRRD